MKASDVIAWALGQTIYCADCTGPQALRRADFAHPMFLDGADLSTRCEACGECIGDCAGLVDWRPSDLADHAARALWGLAYAAAVEAGSPGYEDEEGPGAGGDWMSVCGDPPARYEALAEKLIEALEEVNTDLGALAYKWGMDEGRDPGELGYALALACAGAGVDRGPVKQIVYWDARCELAARPEDLA